MTAPGPLGSAPLGRSGARVEGKVALVTGAARSQGGAHAVRLATSGSIIITSSGAGFKGLPHTAHDTSTKHGLVELMRTLANEYADQWIRVNTVHPTNVDTIMIQNEATWRLVAPDKPQPTRDDAAAALATFNALPIPWVEAGDIANAVPFLASDEARYITGATLPVDAGMSIT